MFEIQTVRIVAAIILVYAAVGVLPATKGHRRTSSRAAKVTKKASISRLYEVLWNIVSFMSLIVLVLAVAIPEVLYDSPFNFSFIGDMGLQLAGIVIYVVALALLLSSIWYLGESFRMDIAIKQNHKLITSGSYARIRHPIYTAVMLGSIAAVLFLLNALLIVNALVCIAIAVHRAKVEEKLLSSEEAFGQSYVHYIERTGMFLPKFKSTP